MKVEVFGRHDCAVCQSVRRKLDHFVGRWGYASTVEIIFVDMDTVDGLAEAAFRDVLDIPTTMVSDNGSVFGRWDGVVPRSKDLKDILSQCNLQP